MHGHLGHSQAERRSSCRRSRNFCKAASARRSCATCSCCNTWLWCLGAFWWGPQVASASQSPCDGRLVIGVGHAATLAWTHSILSEPTFQSVWQASFRALCLSFDSGTLQPQPHHDVVRMTSRSAVGSRKQVRFNPSVSLALGLDDDWRLQSFPIHESVLHDWSEKPWTCSSFSYAAGLTDCR